MTQIPLNIFLYGFVAVIFGPPFLYFAWRTGQRWRRGENLMDPRLYGTCVGYSVIGGARGISSGNWFLAAFALFLLAGSSWMRLVEYNDSRS